MGDLLLIPMQSATCIERLRQINAGKIREIVNQFWKKILIHHGSFNLQLNYHKLTVSHWETTAQNITSNELGQKYVSSLLFYMSMMVI